MRKMNWLLAGTFGLVAAVVYFASMAHYAFPGESAHLLAIWNGLEKGAGEYPLMAAFVRLLGGGNVIAPLCGVVSVVALFHLVSSFFFVRVVDEAFVGQRRRLALIAASVASAVFIFTPAVSSAATHLEPRLFDFTWVLLTVSVAMPILRWRSVGPFVLPVVIGALAAFGLCDTVIFLELAPLFVALTIAGSVMHDRRPYFPLFLLFISALIAFCVALSCFDLAMKDVLHRLFAEACMPFGYSGWVYVLIFTTVPFVVSIISSRRAFGESSGVGPVAWIFHGALTFVVILSVATPLSPSALMEPYGVLPVLTSAFAAFVAGYLAAYWWANGGRAVGRVAGGVLVFVLTVASVWNFFSFDGQAGAFADKVAEKMLKDLGTRRWLVTDGTLDAHLKIVAARTGREVRLVSLVRDNDENYREELAKIVEEERIGGSKNAVLRLSLDLGVLAFVQDWFSSDPTVPKNVAVFGAPDLWMSAGMRPVPEFLFFGADESAEPDWGAWKEFDAILKAPKGWGSYRNRKTTNPVDRLRFFLRRHIGFVANNRGVWLQDQKRDDAAFDMYELVLNEIDGDNICAVFNELGMVGQKHPRAMAKRTELERLLKSAVEDKDRRYLRWRLSTYYGYIRNAESFVGMGHDWARSGRPGDALSHIRRAIDFVPTDKRSGLINMMASLYASENDQKKSRELYESVLKENADDHDALVGMMRLELLNGNEKQALDYLQRAAGKSGDGARAQIELAMVSMMKSDLAGAKAMLKKVTDADAKNMQAWSLLAAVTIQQVDATVDEKAKDRLMKELEDEILPVMEKRSGDRLDYYLLTTRGFVLLRKGEEKRREARDAFVVASKSRPDVSATQDLVLGLDISLNDRQNAEAHARDILRRNRQAPLANYVMGSIALGNNRLDEAESYLRRAADAPQPVLLALNDLAETLRRKKNFADAERYARLATEKAGGLYVVWDTLGAILVDTGDAARLDEAEACIRKACQLSRDKDGRETDVRMLISLARVQAKRKDLLHARVSARKVRTRIDELSEFEKREFEELEKSLK